MTNPIVVFIVPDRFGSALRCEMPVGVNSDGTLETVREDNTYSVLLLDDSKNWRGEDEAPCAICNDDPLLIVKHKRTEKNDEPWETLWGAGSPTVCKSFSHTDDDPVFESIREILGPNKKALRQFVDDCRKVNILQALDGLAAICQIQILDSGENCELGDLEDEFLHRLSDANDLAQGCPRKRLDRIREKANRLLGVTTKLPPESSSDRA